MEERLQKLLSKWGGASRRHAEALIQAGRVLVNDQVAELGQKADPDSDRIVLDGRELSGQKRPELHYFLLNKPSRVVSTCQDPQGRKTVLAFLPKDLQDGAGIHPVGRLDYNSTGALILTNDGNLTHQLTHPSHQLPKTYRVIVKGNPQPAVIDRWRQGIVLAGRRTLPAEVKILAQSATCTELEIVLREGRNRQIRRVAETLGHPVKSLHRIAIGPIHVAELGPGQLRQLTEAELGKLCYRTEEILTAHDVTES